MRNTRNILIVSERRTFYETMHNILPPDEFEINYVQTGAEARRFMINRPVHILIVNIPLSDEHGLMFARDFVDTSMGILLVCPPDILDSIVSEAEENGIIALPNTYPAAFIYVHVKILSSFVTRLEKMEEKNKTMQEKMTEIRTINKAKWLLIEKQNITESEAHKYIEKLAMNNRITICSAAEQIIDSL